MVTFSSLQSLTLSVLLSSTLAVGQSIQVNYYWDGGCEDFALALPNPPQIIFDYTYTGTNSENIANCDYDYCNCQFYVEPNAVGVPIQLSWGGDNCASNWGGGFQSFHCEYGSYNIKRSISGNF